MRYRREIDGLRAIAVVPVILCHAGFSLFQGGFVGVDIFFVISGFLITTLIMNDLDVGRFSILGFYERRARRILPALFLVIAASLPFAYLWTMPDEFKNYGQSILATALFSNNILLAMTADYWSLDSAFKPFLHTWSLGVEEQYYMIFPLILMAAWRYARRHVMAIMAVLFVASLAGATWGVQHAPTLAFYLLPSRGWELLAGAMMAHWLNYRDKPVAQSMAQELAGLAGLAMILFAIFVFDDSYLSPGPWILFPVVGSVLVIAFAGEGTQLNRLLGNRIMVGTGLISYSLYLWHQPLFALARIYSATPVPPYVYAALVIATFVLAYLTWRFVEAPFRDRQHIGAKSVLAFSLSASLCAIVLGLYLNHTYGMYWRAFGRSADIADLDKRVYNSRVFAYKKDGFTDSGKRHLLVVGNSFGRDFINMTTETFDTHNIELAYSDTAQICIRNNPRGLQAALFGKADIIVFASGYDTPSNIAQHCVARDIAWAQAEKKAVFFIGAKNFGYNLNWIIRLPALRRADQYNPLPPKTAQEHKMEKQLVPPTYFISLLDPVMRNGMVPITDDQGRVISTDRMHVTKFGAIYFGQHALKSSAYGRLLISGG
jgi:peptidoglycan/LPS O-acetylase OafA/YrhL